MSEYWVTAPYESLQVRSKKRIFSVHEGKSFIITGAAGGVGRATVELLIAEGARVAAWDVRSEPLNKAIEGFGADKVLALVCDLANQDSIVAAFKASEAYLNKIDGVVNNAATVRRTNPLEAAWSDWHETMATNLYGAYEVSRLACKSMIAKGVRGAIVNVSSEAGKKGHTASVTYGASKAALISMTRILAAAVAPYDINVNCICPGGIATDMLRAAAANYARLSNSTVEEIFPKLTSSQLKRHITPEEVARTMSFLLGDDAMIIRGQAINTDGGDTPY